MSMPSSLPVIEVCDEVYLCVCMGRCDLKEMRATQIGEEWEKEEGGEGVLQPSPQPSSH